MATIFILGGTAAYHLAPAGYATVREQRIVETPFGPSPLFYQLETERGLTVWYGSRHGQGSLERSARFVGHQANLWAIRELGCQIVLSWNGVGAINPTLRVGDLVVPAGIMDWTRNRINSLSLTPPAEAHSMRQAARTIDHINTGREARQVAYPFHQPSRQAILAVANHPDCQATYVCTEGPRLETAAEIDLAANLGADVVGMTLCPEVWLAAELGLAYASLCLVTNFATGRWHLDPRRQFGPTVAERALTLLLGVAESLPDIQ